MGSRLGGRAALLLLGVLLAAPVARAQPGGTDIYLASFDEHGARVVIGAPENVTRHPGYDNQPWFTLGGAFLYSAATDTSGATDVMRFDIAAAATVRVTDTPESEYSPEIMPDGKHISVVRVEADGTQRLWRFDRDGSSPRLIAAGVDSVGYYAWRDDHTVVAFIVGAPHRLCIVDTDRDTETPVALDVGRSIHRIPGSDEVSFLQRTRGTWTLMRLDTDTRRVTPIAEALEESQDCVWTAAGNVLMARGARVYVLDRDRGGWTPVVSFGAPGLQSVTRLAVDPAGRWIALVGSDG